LIADPTDGLVLANWKLQDARRGGIHQCRPRYHFCVDESDSDVVQITEGNYEMQGDGAQIASM
jgi:hypothetical protein